MYAKSVKLLLLVPWSAFVLGSGMVRADDLSDTTKMLDALEASINAIHSYDLRVSEERQVFFTEDEIVIEDGKKVFRQKSKAEVFESPRIDTLDTRQVFQNGSRRVETFETKSGRVKDVFVSDNEHDRTFHPGSMRGEQRKAGLQSLRWHSDYLETFRTVQGPTRILLVLRERQSSIRIYRSSDKNQFIVFEVLPNTKPGITLGAWGFRIFADTKANLLPAIVECFVKKEQGSPLLNRMTVTKRKTISAGIEVPIEIVTESFSLNKNGGKYQEPFARTKLTVDTSRSHWNDSIDSKDFKLDFPTGSLVNDQVRDIAIVTGKSEPGANMDQLAADAQRVLEIQHAAPPSRSTKYWWLSGTLIVVGISIALGWRKYHNGDVVK
jgi:hypothetical protein